MSLALYWNAKCISFSKRKKKTEGKNREIIAVSMVGLTADIY
jgi:hypothetical protein